MKKKQVLIERTIVYSPDYFPSEITKEKKKKLFSELSEQHVYPKKKETRFCNLIGFFNI